ncbi:PTS system, cellobiose-specific IIC component [Caldanaerovirga acetigignens]|uniref:Permease IIC component n=1 Tax=Caldanaerovirga acetigignens TaxID=447595 RepID=A0A1M7L1U9_9FIRM|nr:PTS transporter subunit EIIC [Caldanaerovirga acetigignens]SHM71949.1 PTS system, cellobiose-specific IIC component [Caldanaerovirga acetigignens]
MKFNLEELQKKIMPVATSFSNNKYLGSVMEGLTSLMPIILVGAIATLLKNLPFAPYQTFVTSTGISQYLSILINFTTDIISLLGVFLIAWGAAKKFDVDSPAAGLFGVVAFLVLTPLAVIEKDGNTANYISFEWLGATGLFVSIILGIFVGRLYAYLVQKGLVIKMPEGVPPTITKSFAGLIPGFIISAVVLAIKVIFENTSYGSIHSFIYSFIQTPLQGLGGTIWAFVLVMFVAHLLWLVGLHGMLVAISVMMPIWMALDLKNLEAFNAGLPMQNIPGFAFLMCYTLLGGSGATLGLNLLMLFKAKSQRYKTLGKLAIAAGICGINEPIIFGTPVILNPLMAIPFILTPIILSVVAYIATAIGVVPPLMGAMMPLGTPIIVSGLLQGSWRIAVLQIVLVILSAVIYYPFFKIADENAYEEEVKPAIKES